jgi:hypothetical protein
MTTFTSEDLQNSIPKPGNLFVGTGDHTEEFEVIAVYNPNEEADLWISYRSTRTKLEYSCRLEAFLARFRSIPT